MPNHTSAEGGPSPLAPELRHAEIRGLHMLTLLGALVLLAVWLIERPTGLNNSWDTWAQPLLAALLVGHSAALRRWPHQSARLRASGALCFVVYLVGSVLMLVMAGGAQPGTYAFVSTLYWLPLAYGVCFVALPTAWALRVALLVFVSTFGPIAAAWAGADRLWSIEFETLVGVLGAAQVVYIALLRTVATLRDAQGAVEERVALMQTLATTDVLTGLPNRRAMLEQLHGALSLAARTGLPVAVAVFDVDHFKQINDQHGHGAGDQALVTIGHLLSGPLRGSDRVGRWGGEEFLLVAPGTALGPAAELADRLRRAVEACTFGHGAPLTTSVGVAEYRPGDDADTLLQRADRALYRAKAAGRNRTEAQGESQPTQAPW